MKRTVMAALFVVALAVVLFIHWFKSDPGAPAFRAPTGRTGSVSAYSHLHYEFLSSSPFEGGKMWISIGSGTNDRHCLLYDIDQKQIVGELFQARPVFMNRDQSRLLCLQRGPSRQSLLRQRLTQLFGRISGGKIRVPQVSDDAEVFWVLDLKRNSATRIGDLSQFHGAGTAFQPSPGFRFGFNKPSTGSSKPEFYLCDVERQTFRKIAMDGWPVGWWSDTEMIIKEPANDFALYDVLTEKRSPFLSFAQIAEFLEAAKIPDADPKRANLFSSWNGKQYDFYLTDTHKKWQATNSYLIQIERPDAGLKLMAKEFKFEWSDHLDPTAVRYVYSGREAGARSTGVFLRDLGQNTTRTLVVPDESRYFSLPRFYHDGVIYVRSNMLWWIDLNGFRNTCVFPPPAATQQTNPEAWQ